MTIAVDWDVKHQFKQTNKKRTNKHFAIWPYLFFISLIRVALNRTCDSYEKQNREISFFSSKKI